MHVNCIPTNLNQHSLGYVEQGIQGIETQGSDGQQSDLFEGFISEVG